MIVLPQLCRCCWGIFPAAPVKSAPMLEPVTVNAPLNTSFTHTNNSCNDTHSCQCNAASVLDNSALRTSCHISHGSSLEILFAAYNNSVDVENFREIWPHSAVGTTSDFTLGKSKTELSRTSIIKDQNGPTTLYSHSLKLRNHKNTLAIRSPTVKWKWKTVQKHSSLVHQIRPGLQCCILSSFY